MKYFLNLFSGILNTSSELLEFLRNPSFTKRKITKKELANLFILKIFLVFANFSILNLFNLDFEEDFKYDPQSILD